TATSRPSAAEIKLHARSEDIVGEAQSSVHRRTDRVFAGLLALQWAGALVLAFQWDPGEALARGGLLLLANAGIIVPTMALIVLAPGRATTRHVVALAQMLTGAILVYLTGEPITMHVHAFGSLALLSLYGNYRVLLTATAATLLGTLGSDLWRSQAGP